jgi:hypothetical protein
MCTFNVLVQLDLIDEKLQENIMLSSPDAITRRFSRSILRSAKPVFGLKPKFEKI